MQTIKREIEHLNQQAARIAEIRKEIAATSAKKLPAAPSLLSAARKVLEELTDRYDGCPDSKTLWMGEHIDRLSAAISAADGRA